MKKIGFDLILNPFILIIALFAIFATHIYLLLNGSLVNQHSWINLISITYIALYLWKSIK